MPFKGGKDKERVLIFKIVKYEPRQIFTDGIFRNQCSGDGTISNVAVYFALHGNSADGLYNCLAIGQACEKNSPTQDDQEHAQVQQQTLW